MAGHGRETGETSNAQSAPEKAPESAKKRKLSPRDRLTCREIDFAIDRLALELRDLKHQVSLEGASDKVIATFKSTLVPQFETLRRVLGVANT